MWKVTQLFQTRFSKACHCDPCYPLGDDDLVKISIVKMNRIDKRVKAHYNAEFSYDKEVMLHIVARNQEVDTCARNIENILTRTMMPEMPSECLWPPMRPSQKFTSS